MTASTEPVTRPESERDKQVRFYRIISICLCSAFVAVGLVFLFVPGEVILFFNSISRLLGMAEAPMEGAGFYLVLAAGYMYVVSYLAWKMFRIPSERQALQVLIQAKSASSILSILFFAVVHPYLIFLTNGVVDGAIAAGLLVIRVRWKGLWP
jgi:hypothetical protein